METLHFYLGQGAEKRSLIREDIYTDLALRIGGVSDETVTSGYGFCATLTRE
jgi:hypothetical protein